MNSGKKINKKIKNIGVVILAGGLGTRMKSDDPKALAGLLENPLIFYSIESLINAVNEPGVALNKDVALNKIGTVIGHKGELVKKYILEEKRFERKGLSLDFAVQESYLGTGDAVLKGLDMFPEDAEDTKETDILILPCDMPLIKPETYAEMIKFHLDGDNDITVLSAETPNPYSYGRILRDGKGFAEKIIEEKELCDYPSETAKINEINSGVYIVKLNRLKKFITQIKPDNRKKEYYFTDLINIFYRAGLKVVCYKASNSEDFAGVNSKLDLLNAQKLLQNRLIKDLIEKGVNFISADNVYIGYNVAIEENSVIYPGVFLSGKTVVSKGAIIENGCVIKDSVIGNKSQIKSYSVLENAVVMNDVQIGPFARLRPDSLIGEGSKIGNFVEVKKSKIGKNTKASHLSYIGDSIIGNEVNIGAGVITCNYDGIKKYQTVIEDGCFIGSDSQLVAPVKIGKDSYVGSGATITKDIPEGALAISRVPQRNIEGWALKKIKSEKKEKRKKD